MVLGASSRLVAFLPTTLLVASAVKVVHQSRVFIDAVRRVGQSIQPRNMGGKIRVTHLREFVAHLRLSPLLAVVRVRERLANNTGVRK